MKAKMFFRLVVLLLYLLICTTVITLLSSFNDNREFIGKEIKSSRLYVGDSQNVKISTFVLLWTKRNLNDIE